MSLANDELSGLWSSYAQPTWHDMMVNGILTDGHPPLYHILIRYWVMAFGDSVLSIRIPFVMAGVMGLYFMYRTGVLWFGRTPALLAVSLLSVISYSIYYHQIARPYALGFLFVQAAAFYWTEFLFGSRKKSHLLLWIAMAVLSCYTHYFSMMAVGIMGLTGLFFLNKENYRAYLFSGFAIVILLLPGFAVFRQQISYNGLGWLGPPGRDWLIDFFAAALNNSALIYLTLFMLVLFGIVEGIRSHKLMANKFQIIGISWFFISFLIGYLKSVYSLPVLQTSCLIFTFPFLVLVVFSFWTESIPLLVRASCIALLLGIGFYDTAIRDRYYTTEHHGEFKVLAAQMAAWSDQYGSDAMHMTNVNNPYYWDYYWVRTMHRSEKISLYEVNEEDDVHKMDSILSTSNSKYFIYAWSTKPNPDGVFKVIDSHYPHLIADPQHFNSGIRLYSK
jgi:4-amino-4-deoxy-L-arabinose transferase-like glycosyltransferase